MIELQMFNKPLPPHYCKTDVNCWHGKFSRMFNWNTKEKFLKIWAMENKKAYFVTSDADEVYEFFKKHGKLVGHPRFNNVFIGLTV